MRVIDTETFLKECKLKSSQDVDFELDRTVLSIIENVRKKGDAALHSYTEQFDGVLLTEIVVSENEFIEANEAVSESFRTAIRRAKERITAFHFEQKERSWFIGEKDGVLLGQQVTPIERVGIYVPGGKAAYPSTVLMNALPAKIAGVEQIVIATPPQPDGKVNPYVLVAAKEAGVDRVYKMGGAQAIAALAYGTESIERVMKITGPGNAYVARAKKWVFGDVAIDMIAGPSEICIVADETAKVEYVAADLLSQAEHDERATAICITTNKKFAHKLSNEVQKQLLNLERASIAASSIEAQGRIIVTNSIEESLQLLNDIAPEHLQLMVNNPMELLPKICNAGAIFLGNYSPEALGDYMAGPNHTLPTSGTAAFSSPLGVYDFVKRSSIIHFTNEAFNIVAEDVVQLAAAEGLAGHANSISIRKGG